MNHIREKREKNENTEREENFREGRKDGRVEGHPAGSSLEHATFALSIVSLGFTLGIELT